MMFSSLCNNLRATLSSFEMFSFGGFDFSSACLTFRLSSSAEALVIFKATFAIRAIEAGDLLDGCGEPRPSGPYKDPCLALTPQR